MRIDCFSSVENWWNSRSNDVWKGSHLHEIKARVEVQSSQRVQRVAAVVGALSAPLFCLNSLYFKLCLCPASYGLTASCKWAFVVWNESETLSYKLFSPKFRRLYSQTECSCRFVTSVLQSASGLAARKTLHVGLWFSFLHEFTLCLVITKRFSRF